MIPTRMVPSFHAALGAGLWAGPSFICTRKDVIDKPFPALACSRPRNASVR